MGKGVKEKQEFKSKIEPFMIEIKNRIDIENYNLIYDYYFKDTSIKQIAKLQGVSDSRIASKKNRVKEKVEIIVDSLTIDDGQIVPKPITLDSKIEHLFFPSRVNTSLKRNKIYKIKDLAEFTLIDIARFRNMGIKGLKDLVDILRANGLNPEQIFIPTEEEYIDFMLAGKVKLSEIL